MEKALERRKAPDVRVSQTTEEQEEELIEGNDETEAKTRRWTKQNKWISDLKEESLKEL